MSKHFVINPSIERLSKGDLMEMEVSKASHYAEILSQNESNKKKLLSEKHSLKAPEGRVIIQIDIESKNSYTFSNGQKIRYERQFDNLNRRHTEPINAYVIDAENIPQGSEILIHHNAISAHHQIHNYRRETNDIKYYSIPIEMCFFYRSNDEWLPLPPYEKCLRVFKPYKGFIEGVQPELIKDTLYILTGEYKGLCCRTLKASDYEVIFQDINGREGRILRCRPNGDAKLKREPEVVAVDNQLTKKVNKGEILIGLSESDAKTLKKWKQ